MLKSGVLKCGDSYVCDGKAFKHHNVPKTYLKPWAFESNNRSARVDTYLPSRSYLGHAATKNILNRENLYTVYVTV